MSMDVLASLRITRRSDGSSPERMGAGLILEAESDWKVEGPPGMIHEILESLPHVAERLSEGLLLLHFGNEVGVAEIPHVGRVEVRSRKWGNEHFQRMLEELSRIAVALPFSVARPAALPFARSVPIDRDVLYHAWVYLRWAVLEAAGEENLERAVRLVLSDPHEVLERAHRTVPVGLAGRVDARELQRLASGAEPFVTIHGSTSPLAEALDGHAPAMVEEPVSTRSLDTPENRFVLSLLDQCLWVVDRMEKEVIEGGWAAGHPRVKQDNEQLRRRLGLLRRERFWRDVGAMRSVPAGSTVLQRRRGYRDLFEHFVRLRLAARVPLDPQDADRLLESKDIATLYELWCYFKVVDAVKELAGQPTAAVRIAYDAAQASVSHGFEVSWKNGIQVVYNATFSRAGRRGRRSYSVQLRPDIALVIPLGENAGLHLLDAKFRIDGPAVLFDGESEDDLPATSFKKADLYKMHTYRDAIPEARSVWVLYPGNGVRFYDTGMALESRSLDSLPCELDGVGAVPLRPDDGGGSELNLLIQRLLRARAV